VWYQPEEIFPVNGIPEAGHHIFWTPVDKTYFKMAGKLKVIKLIKLILVITYLLRKAQKRNYLFCTEC